ncbi:MAG: helix-turn-helix domain-containing protein [Candidatus Thorarchaeota archaeon]
MPISKFETVQTEVAKLIPFYSSSLFFKMHNVFKNRTTFSILLWLYEHSEGLVAEDVVAGFNLSRASAFRYCRMLVDAKVVERTWDVAKKDDRAYAKNRFVINEYGKKLIGGLMALEKGNQS